MQYYHSKKPISIQNTAVACGKFDGIHLGHQALLNKLFEYEAKGLAPTVFTFDSSISKMMNHDGFIYTGEERRYILSKMGIAYLAEYAFDEAMASMSAKQFIEEILVQQLGAKAIVVGEDFHFGYEREGNVDVLKHYAARYGYELSVVSKQQDNEGRISSSRIRDALCEGNMEKAFAMLGRPYFIKGEVIHGRKLGRTIGMPTANVAVPEGKLVPPRGVYVSRNILRGQTYYGITNIGMKPTVKGEEMGVETFLFDFDADIYGAEMIVEFLHFKRPEQCFENVAELTKQMKKDAEYGRKMAADYKKDFTTMDIYDKIHKYDF